jgi:DNA mismatch repair protein MutL
MTRIRRLPDHLVNKIAAGEVVERPASVVKELVENAIDADAHAITVDLRDAGRQLIRVTDDGAGMAGEEIELALMRHATSKLASEADLEAVATLGFRGEALPAICAVSRFALRSCPRGGDTGTLVRGEGGAIGSVLSVAAPAGTAVEIQDIFYNTPARLKFMKGAQAELAATLRSLQATALANPGLRFEVTHNGRPLLLLPAARALRERAGALYGFDVAGRLLDVERTEHGVRVCGLIGPPALARGTRDQITLIVNRRPVRDTLLAQTLLEAYRPLLPRDRFPVAVLHVALSPREVDVNVHPTKAWVRFRAPRAVQEVLFAAVQAALRAPGSVPEQAGLAQGGGSGLPGGPQGPDDEGAAGAPASAPPGVAAPEPAGALSAGLFREEVAPFGPGRFGTVVGQLQDTFVVSADDHEVFFVDQHVAHERVLFERLQRALGAGALPAQELLFPQPLELAPDQRALLAEWGDTLALLGFALEGFGGSTILLRAVPTLLAGEEPRRLIESLVGEAGAPAAHRGHPILDRALAFVACRAAIKAPAPLEREEMQRLLRDLDRTDTPYFCPHGRPIVSRLSLREIRRELRRTW